MTTYNKVTLDGTTLMDISDTTAVASDVASGKYFYTAGGVKTAGTASGQPSLQTKTVTPTTSQQSVTPDSGYDGLSSVTVNAIPSQYIVPSGTKSITSNGTGIDVTAYASVDVEVPSSGGSQQLTFIEEISIDEAAHIIPINFNSSWLNYNYILFYANLEISSSDWIYFQKNTTSISGSVYTNQLSVLNDVGIGSKSGSTLYIKLPGTKTISQSMKSGDVLNVIPYTSSKNFKAGSFIRVYGGMFTDLV